MSHFRRNITELELRKEFESNDSRFAGIRFKGEMGMAILLGENLSKDVWLSGDIICFWEDGENTVLPDYFDLLSVGIYSGTGTKL